MRVRAIILLAPLASCASPSVQPPTLAPRAAEAIDPRLPVADAQQSTAVDPALATRLQTLIDQAQIGDSAFQRAAAEAQRTAAAAGAAQSESWVVAQQGLSALIAARGPVTRALADIDALASQRIAQLGGIAAADMRAIQAAAAQVSEIDRRQSALVSQLQAQLG